MPPTFDLLERTRNFALEVRSFVKLLPNTLFTKNDIIQVIRSSGSVGANYIEANQSLSKKDFIMRIKICRKEVKESRFWPSLFDTASVENLNKIRLKLMNESTELESIFGAILQKSLVALTPNSNF
jgi:four helix bundle protein